jgi:pyridoxamine 5'-phosphate oxidase
MTLATATSDGLPSARIVLLKGFDHEGFVFFTNYESRKGSELEQNPRAALNFHWPWLERQIQIEGLVQKVSREESQIYFDKRPLGSRLSAIVSAQSKPIGSRRELETRLKKVETLGADIALYPKEWSSGRVAKTGCTTGFSTCAKATNHGESIDSTLDGRTNHGCPQAHRSCLRRICRRRCVLARPWLFV